MQTVIKKTRPWLLPVLVMLFMLEMITFPVMLRATYADTTYRPAHMLTYKAGSLTWDSSVGIDPVTGSKMLNLFSPEYDGTVISEDGRKVAAPGTGGSDMVRLHNTAPGAVNYTAVLYYMTENDYMPLKGSLQGDGFTDILPRPHASVFPDAALPYILPAGVTEENVIRAVGGSVGSNQIQNIGISWVWDFFESDAVDVQDTALGSDENAAPITLGLYIVVEDNNDYSIPQTGDNSHVGAYLLLMVMSAAMILLLLADLWFDRRRLAAKPTGDL